MGHLPPALLLLRPYHATPSSQVPLKPVVAAAMQRSATTPSNRCGSFHSSTVPFNLPFLAVGGMTPARSWLR
jgi:hypothetical protein